MLSDRQIKLLEAIIKEYSESSEPVGSKTIVKKYLVKVSPATIRNDMAELLEEGFLEMLHTSSGRIPTSQAFRFFIEKLMHEEELPVLQEVAFKQRLWPQRYEFEKMLRNAVLSLAEATGHLALGFTSDGFLTQAGVSNILNSSEFWNIDTAKSALEFLDRQDVLEKLFGDLDSGHEVTVAVGKEIGLENMDKCALVFSPFSTGKKTGYISVFGPSRMKYSFVVPAVRYTGNLIEELVSSW
jgi:transcriptional regulator of heat shock response